MNLAPLRASTAEPVAGRGRPEEMVVTGHPQGKQNKPVRRADYDIFAAAITAVLGERPLTHTELVDHVTRRVAGTFGGNASWHTMTVKLDLEARGVIEREGTRPVRYRLR